MAKRILRVAALAAALAMLTLMVPSFTPLAIGEEGANTFPRIKRLEVFMAKRILRVAALAAALAMLTLMVPSFTPLAIGEEGLYPVYEPVELPLKEVAPMDYQAEAPYAPHADGFFPDGMGYQDDSLSIRIQEFRAYDTTCILPAWLPGCRWPLLRSCGLL